YAHVMYIESLVRFHKLPDIGPHYYSYESFQPPLYYMLGAAMVVTWRSLTGNRRPDELLAPRVQANPVFSNTSQKTQYQAFLHPGAVRWPLWPYALRVVSILMGLGVVLLTYTTARALVPAPAPPLIPIVATAFVALIPQANFVRASVSNENLADLIAAWIVWLLVLHLSQPYSRRRV